MGYANEIRNRQDRERTLHKSIEINIRLYTDKSHFIYELLQNAEDAEATKIQFTQYPDRLEVMHDGSPFTTENLLGLCDIGLSSKANDLNKIGEFGVGFKAVYGICETVYLYSQPSKKDLSDDCRPFAVAIHDFIDPEDIEPRKVPDGYTTLFVFPYCVGKSFSGFDTVESLNRKLSERLKNLESTTLLFMKRLESISYEIDLPNEKAKGCYIQHCKPFSDRCHLADTIGECENGQIDETSYLVFSKPISEESPRTIDIAFSMVRGTDGAYCVKPTDSPYVSVYFPTGTESKLSFIVQGPYVFTLTDITGEYEYAIGELINVSPVVLYHERIDFD